MATETSTAGAADETDPAPRCARAGGPVSPWLFRLLLAVSLLNAWPFAAFEHAPFEDHPSHLLKANIIRHYADPAWGYAENFRINAIPASNVLLDYLTAGLATLLPIDAASRLLLGLYVFLLPLSVWFWLGRAAPGRQPWAFLVPVMAWSRFLWYGNENFCASACLLFFLWGILAGWNGRASAAKILACTALATLIYLGHFLVFALAGLGVFIHILTAGPRSIRTWLSHGLIVLPGIVLAALWFGSGFGTQQKVIDWQTSLPLKLLGLAKGLLPFPWAYPELWVGALGVGLLVFILYRAVKAWRDGRVFPAAVCLACMAVAAALPPRWFVIFIPDQRLWWILALTALAVFPALSGKARITALVLGIALTAGTWVRLGSFFATAERHLAHVERVFETFPPHLRLAYIGYPELPSHLHRAFEYYHLRHGGVGPHHLLGPDQSVSYADPSLPASRPNIYAFGSNALGDWLYRYDAVLLVSPPELPVTQAMIRALTEQGFSPRTPPPVALLVNPAKCGMPPNSQPAQRIPSG